MSVNFVNLCDCNKYIYEEIEIDLGFSHLKSCLKQDCIALMSLPYWVVDWGSSELSGVSLASFKDQFDNFFVAFKALFGYFWLAHSGIYSSNVLIFFPSENLLAPNI